MISVLPEGILHNILSWLTEAEAFEFCVQSKALFNAWLSKPNLVFTYGAFSPEEIDKNRKALERYSKQGIDSLEILNDTNEFESDTVIDLWNSWIQTAAENGAKKIKYFPIGAPICWLDLPPIVFQAKSLVDLQVRGCELKLQGVENIGCHNLKHLELCCGSFNELVLEKIISNCQLIDHLEIADCEGFDNLKVIKLEKLKRFELRSLINCSIEVQAARLEYFECSVEYFECSVDDIGEGLSMLTLHACPNLKILSLSGIRNVDEIFSNFESKFPQLEDLEIHSCRLPRRMRILSQSVKKLRMSWNKELKKIEIDAPSMEIFKIYANVMPKFVITAVSKHCTYKKNGQRVHSLLD